LAKKNIISDFSALKGKVTFSEPSSVATAGLGAGFCACPAKPVSTPKEQHYDPAAGRVLQVGQKVVLMDSDLRGKIVSLGRTVWIELEDGLKIKAAYGEFAVTDDGEITALKQSKVKHKKTPASSKANLSKPNSNTLEVDLHIEAIPGGRNVPKGQQLEFQMETFRKVVRDNARHRGRTITFIHGIGDGILKAAIRKELDEVHALRCSYSVGDPAVTVVTIR
jgi:hypothetical protein